MGNCCGERLKGPKYTVSERRMEVDGKLYIETKEETTITMDDGKKITQIEVTRTITDGERTCTVISESNKGTGQKEMSVTQKIGRGLTPAEAAAFQDEWFLQPSKKSGD